MRRLAILLIAAVAAGALANALHTYSGRGSGTVASGMIARSCLTLWYGGQRGQPFCWESRLEGI